MDLEEEFEGFDLESGADEKFPCRRNEFDVFLPDVARPLVTRNSDFYYDSDGSFFDDGGDDGANPGELTNSKGGKRRSTKKEIQKLQSAEKRRDAHAIKLIDCRCKKECTKLVAKDDRLAVHREFWELDIVGQRSYIRERVVLTSVTRRLRYSSPNDPSKMHSYNFHIRTIGSNEFIRVCRKFFMNTIGYDAHCGNIVYRMVNDDDDANLELDDTSRAPKRGKYVRSTQKRDSVPADIQKYNPTISHYRRAHAPNRLYLPAVLSEKSMHEHYSKTHDLDVSYAFYCRVLKDMNISLVKLGHEQCESCIMSTQHQKQSGHSTSNEDTGEQCSICEQYVEHLRLANISRKAYREDGDNVIPGNVVLVVDLQKVVQLPRLDGLKTVVFSQRLIAFNETFAPVGKYAQSTPVVACLWTEAVSGRSSNDILGCFHRVVERFRDKERLVLWLDNCAAQNKNWNLFLHLIVMINSEAVQLKEVVFKYFESGHTFMSADSFHAAVEGGMRRRPPITYPDFKAVVEKAKANVEMLDMEPDNFFPHVFSVSQYVLNKIKPRPYMDQIRKVVFKKGSYQFHYSSGMTEDDGDEKSCMLFTAKQLKTISSANFNLNENLKRADHPQGIDTSRKDTLLKTIIPLIDEAKKPFWNELPEKVTVAEST